MSIYTFFVLQPYAFLAHNLEYNTAKHSIANYTKLNHISSDSSSTLILLIDATDFAVGAVL